MSDEKITKDIAIPLGRSEDGNLQLLRVQGTDERPTQATIGELRPLEEGKPIMGEVVRLKPVEGARHLDVETVLADPYKAEKEKAPASAGGGSKTYSFPSTKYQENWARIFGSKPGPSEVN